ncbi:xanthine dehydrogenase family protein subunit M [Nocardioides sp. InS609-2]|uniref:FAD binding domain-containing protein n=1 Tax=Nocardioides sp. InS609-2 TaxID=2760705 RepID=UPI0020C09E48|nr:xanthine dehydrogenase family protein subunit M [Nocardioides sp. InS609-2]
MRPFDYERPGTLDEAVSLVAFDPDASYIAGGSNLVDHLKLGVATPTRLVDVRGLPLADIEETADGLRIGANVRNSDLAAHPAVRSQYAVLSRALLSGASAQIRHQATAAGNLLQRTRCVYFADATTPCNKREPGSGCSAIGGYDRYNAVLGTSESCVATHPSDMAVALAVLDASVEVLGADGVRTIPLADLHRLPGDSPEHDTSLVHGELITAVTVPALPDGAVSTYYKARDRASYAFALVSVAAVVAGDEVRVAWGGVAHQPWRATRLEAALHGGPLDEDPIRAACADELADAVTSEGNSYKLAMITGATAMVLTGLAGGPR